MDQALFEIHAALGIGERQLAANRLSLHPQPKLEELRVVDIDFEGKPFVLLPSTARAWRAMQKEARTENVELLPYSGFRSYLHQKGLIERHLKNGQELDAILARIAIPGFSEHHSGRAIDIYAPGRVYLEEDFETAEAYAWLVRNADRFQFRLSYPRGNPFGVIYEPWHWFYFGD